MMFPVDAVITWVDGNDPVLNRKRCLYGNTTYFERDDLAGSTRYANCGEIEWCVASINKYAPFIRKIYIITDGQDPHLTSRIPVEVVDHSVVFKGFEDFLPVFNALSIETFFWQIPGMSEHFVYFNDDMMLVNPVSVSDFFEEDGTPRCYGSVRSSLITTLTRRIKRTKDGIKRCTFKGVMLNAAKIAGSKHIYIKVDHTPRGHRRSFYQDFFSKRPDYAVRNVKYRFRDADQFMPDLLEYVAGYLDGTIRLTPVSKVLFYMMPKPKKDYVARKMAKLEAGKYLFCCFNSLDAASEEDRAMVVDWIRARLGNQ